MDSSCLPGFQNAEIQGIKVVAPILTKIGIDRSCLVSFNPLYFTFVRLDYLWD